MKKTIFTDPVRSFTDACDNYKSGNPLLMHKSFRMEDCYYRKNSPKDSVVRVEFGMDSEHYVIAAAAALLGIFVVCKAISSAKRSAEKRRMKMLARHRCSRH